MPVSADAVAVWNEPFQTAVDLPSTLPRDAEERSVEINAIADRFVGAAEPVAMTILSELHAPVPSRTIRPVDVGGVAGGIKYSHAGLFLKVRAAVAHRGRCLCVSTPLVWPERERDAAVRVRRQYLCP